MANTAIFTKNDTMCVLRTTLIDPDNNNLPINVTGFTVKLYSKSRQGGAGPTAITGTLADAANGIVEFDCATICSYTTGISTWPETFDCQIEITDTTPKVQRSEDFTITVKDQIT